MRIPLHIPKRFKAFKRTSAVILPKDAGAIIAYADINKHKTIIEGGTGTGFMTAFLAGIAKHVTSYEKREDFFKNAKNNLKDYENITLINKDILEGVKGSFDIAVLDMKDAHKGFEAVKDNIKETIVAYQPSAQQVINFTNTVSSFNEFEQFVLEIIVRDYKFNRGLRPNNIGLIHTAYLCFAKRK